MGSGRPPLLQLHISDSLSGSILLSPPPGPLHLFHGERNGTSELGSSGSKSYLGTSAWLSHTHRLESNAGERLVKFNRLDNGASASVYKAVDAETLQLIALKEVAVTDAKSRDIVRHEVAALELQRVPGSLPPRQRPPLREAGAEADAAAGGIEAAGDLDGFADDPELVAGANDGAFNTTMSPYIVKFYGCTVRQGGAGPAAATGGLPPRRASCAIVTLALEYCCGGNLQAWVDAKRPWSVPWVALLATQSISALMHLHKHHHLHRDIKPANLLLTRGGGVKMADFGLSIVSRPGDNGMRDTMVGTKAYMAPERLRAERYSHHSDVFSLGLALASIVLGESPVPKAESEFEQLGLAEAAAAVVRSRCGASAENNYSRQDVPPLLADLLAEMLTPDAAARPAAAELLHHPFFSNVPQFPSSSPECAAVVEALAEQRRRGQRSAETPQLLQRLAAARLDRYQVGVEAGSAAAAGAAALADDLGMSESEFLRALDVATEAELKQRIGSDLTARLLESNGCGGGGSCGRSGGVLGFSSNGRDAVSVGRGAASSCIQVPGLPVAAGERLRGLLLEMSVGAPEELGPGDFDPDTGSSARSTALSNWGSDGEAEGGTPHSFGGIDGAATGGAGGASGSASGCSVSAGAGNTVSIRRPLGLRLSPVQARRSRDRSNGRGSLRVPSATASAAASGDYVPLSLAGAAGGWPPRAASAGGALSGGDGGEPGLWLDVLENELARESAMSGTGLPSPVRGVVRRPRTARI